MSLTDRTGDVRPLAGAAATVLAGALGLFGGRVDRVAPVLLTALLAVVVVAVTVGRRRTWQVAVVATAITVASLLDADEPFARMGLVLGWLLAVVAIGAALLAVRRSGWARTTAAAVAVGAAGLSVTGLRTGLQLSFLVLTGLSATAAVRGGLDLARALGVPQPAPSADRDRVVDLLSYDRDRTGRFLVLMVLSTTIAALGVMTDSTAVVIGAMLVAPHMPPRRGVSVSRGMGWLGRARQTAGVAAAGIVLAVGLSALLAAVLPVSVALDANPQVTARTAPTLLDLAVALAAGTAGAYALSRPDVSDALPGVAVAISLVPPLAVAGIAIQQGARAATAGALLLFTTNMVAILVAGVVVFGATGVIPRRGPSDPATVRATAAVLGAALCVVIGGLSLSGQRLLEATSEVQQVEATVEAWAADLEGAAVDLLEVDDDVVTVELSGPPPDLVDPADLAGRLAEALGREVTVRVFPRQVLESTGSP